MSLERVGVSQSINKKRKEQPISVSHQVPRSPGAYWELEVFF